MARFTVPDIQNPDKQLSKFTITNYKAYLNKLAAAGFENIAALQEKPEEVVKAVDKILEGKPDQNFRVMYCAIFYVLADTDYKSKTKVYYNAFRAHVNSAENPDAKKE
jgi:hypothetical protein